MATNKKQNNKQTIETNTVITTGTDVMLVNEDKQTLVGEVLPPEVANEGGDMTEQSDDDMLNGLGLGDDNNEVDDQPEPPKVEPTMADLMAIIQAQQEQLNKMTEQQAAARPANAIKGTLLSGNNSTTKADLARTIWDDEMTKHDMTCPARGHTITRLCNEAGLTKAGAATYYQNMKKKAGFVNSK